MKRSFILHTPRTTATRRGNNKAVGGNPRSQEDKWGMVEGRTKGSHRNGTGETQNHSSLPRRTSLRTSRDQLNERAGGQVLLVAATSQGGTRVRQGMCPMPTKQSKHPSAESSSEPDHANNRGLTISDYIYGLHCETTRVSRIRLYLDHHGP